MAILHKVTIGEYIEQCFIYGMQNFDESHRALVIEYISSFEECYMTKEEMQSLSTGELISRSYWIMNEYVKGIN